MAEFTEHLKTEVRTLRELIESGAICSSCLTHDCDRVFARHFIHMTAKVGYQVECCSIEASRLQEKENLRQRGVLADLVAGLRTMAGLPERFAKTTFRDFKLNMENGAACAAAVMFAKEYPNKSILIFGNTGLGKTMLICAALNSVLEAGHASRYLYAPDMLEMLRQRMKESEFTDITYRELIDKQCLAIDDLGVDRDTDWTVSVYTRIIDGRYRNKKPTILATNLDMESLERVVGQRSMSRIIEAYRVVEITGEDRRMS